MTAAISRREAWARLAALIDLGLPDPESIDFNVPSGNQIVALNLDTVEDLHAWARALGCEIGKPVQHPGSDKIQHHADVHRGWHGLSVSLWTYVPAATSDLALGGGEVAGPDGAGSATTPAEGSPAGPAVVPTTPGDDGGDSRLQDQPGQTAVPAPVAVGDGAAVTPVVWVAVRRRGINYHDLTADDSRTMCDRSTALGLPLLLTEALDLGCPRCPICHRKSQNRGAA